MLSHGVLNPTMRVLSHGGGVQTSALAMAAQNGLVGPLPDFACMGDTRNEPGRVYDYLDIIRPLLSFPIETISLGDILDHVRRSKDPDAGRSAALPYYLVNPDGGKGRAMRQCTRDFKIEAVTQAIRRKLGTLPGQRPPMDTLVEIWIGISTDEVKRAGGYPHTVWQHVRYPLLELDWSRNDCLEYLRSLGLPEPPKSSCIICPFRSDEQWLDLTGAEFDLACEYDELLRADGNPTKGMDGLAFLHSSRRPLREVKLNPRAKQEVFDCMGGCAT